MKNTEEMVSSLLKRREEYNIKQRQHTRRIISISTSVVSIAILISVAFVVPKALKGEKLISGSNATGIIETTEGANAGGYNNAEVNDSSPAQNTESNGINEPIEIIWVTSDLNENEGFTTWNAKQVTFRLEQALSENVENALFAISARPYIDGTFEYKGKTLSEYELEASEERNLTDKLMQLLKSDGDSLKYGEKLYTSGTPDGEIWIKELYDEKLAFYGENIMVAYFQNGEFLKDKLEADIEKALDEHKAQNAYLEAKNAYLLFVANSVVGSSVSEINYSGNYGGYGEIVMIMNRESFEKFTGANIDEWIFDLASKEKSGDECVEE